jgi:hypothetical protein
VNMVMNFHVHKMQKFLLTVWGTISFWRRNLLHGVMSVSTLDYSETSIYRSQIRRSISVVPEQILFQLWLLHLLFSRIHCFFFRPPTKTMNRGFTVYNVEWMDAGEWWIGKDVEVVMA